MRVGRTKVANHASQGRIGPGAHVHGLNGQPNLLDRDHVSNSRANRANPCGSSLGHCSLSCIPLWPDSSMLTLASDWLGRKLGGWTASAADGPTAGGVEVTGIQPAGLGAHGTCVSNCDRSCRPNRSCSFTQRCKTLGFMPLATASDVSE